MTDKEIENPKVGDEVVAKIRGVVVETDSGVIRIKLNNRMVGWINLADIVEVIPKYLMGDEIYTTQPEPPIGTELRFLGPKIRTPIYRFRTIAGWVRLDDTSLDVLAWSEFRKDVKWRITYLPVGTSG